MHLGFEGMGSPTRSVRVEFGSVSDLTNGIFFHTWVTGEAFPRMIFKCDGTILKGNGTVAPV